MKNFLLILTFVVFTMSTANAQIDLGIETSSDANKEEKKEEKAEVKTPNADEKKEGAFSFMNFSFSKDKKKAETTEAKAEESFIDKTTRLAEEGNLDAQLSLGYMYLYGDNNVPVDYKKSFRYYSMAAEQNDPIALNNLGSLYYSGIGTDKDNLKAVEMFKKASSLGNSESAVNLGFIYLTGSGVRKDNNQAMMLFSKAAREGNPTAQFMLGYAYYKGFVMPKDSKKAFEFIKAAADAQYADANYILAHMYLEGIGTTKNYGNAVRNFTRGAMQGDVESMLALADIYTKGQVYSKNIYQAHIWYNIAALYGAKGAGELRDKIEEVMKIEEVLQAQAEAEKFNSKPSELTNYIRNTFGYNIRGYLDQP